MKQTASRQRNSVSEGMALGLLMNGTDELPMDKVIVDLAFEGEFPRWSHSRHFPQVVTDLRNGLDGYIAITRADERKQAYHLFWSERGWPYVIHARARWDDMDIDPREVAASIHKDIPADAWGELARDFLSHFAD